MNTWKETRLARELNKRREHSAAIVDPILASLELEMAKIQPVLVSGVQAGSPNITLHDAGHAFRVAERMVEILPAKVIDSLSEYELTLLLYAAYLHDIGMTPSLGLVRAVSDTILAGNPAPQGSAAGLSPSEAEELVRFMDERGLELGVWSGESRIDILARARILTADYCRARHNEWSEHWIRANLSSTCLPTYTDCINDIVTLCKSHHWGYSALEKKQFDTRRVAPAGQLVNLRYLACLLRVADILENDPKRTPRTVLAQREPWNDSLLYWHRDHHFTCTFVQNDRTLRQLKATARPNTAAMEKAVRDTVDSIERELRLVRVLEQDGLLRRCFAEPQLHYTWDIYESVLRDVEASQGQYVYVDGSFRPNTEKLLHILGGTNFYREPWDAIRELLQNAFDAIREQIAHERLTHWKRHGQEQGLDWESSPKATEHSVVVSLREQCIDGDVHYWLDCQDDGVGMTRYIIENHVLVSGVGARAETRALERECKQAGFVLGRTGQFGIGCLSYFMIADEVHIETRRSQDAGGDTDVCGWDFRTRGISDFGELRKSDRVSRGTRISLLLKRSLCDALIRGKAARGELPIEVLARYVAAFLSKTLVYAPCPVRVCGMRGIDVRRFSSGWTKSESELLQSVFPERLFVHRPLDDDGLMTEAQRTKVEKKTAAFSGYWREISRGAKWQHKSIALPDGLGECRISIPYFNVNGERILAFVRQAKNRSNRRTPTLEMKSIGGAFAAFPQTAIDFAWRGMAIVPHLEHADEVEEKIRAQGRMYGWPVGGHVAVDLRGVGGDALSANRARCSITASQVQLIRNAVISAARELRSQLLKGARPKELSGLNALVANTHITGDYKFENWLEQPKKDGENWSWSKLPSIYVPKSLTMGGERPCYNGTQLPLVPSLGEPADPFDPRKGPDLWHRVICPWRMVEFESVLFRVLPLYKRGHGAYASRYLSTVFPPGWKNLLCVTLQNASTVFNLNSPVWKNADLEKVHSYGAISTKEFAVMGRNLSGDLVGSATWLCALAEYHAMYSEEIFELLGGKGAEVLKASGVFHEKSSWLGMLNSRYGSRLTTIRPEGVSFIDFWHAGRDVIRNYLPRPKAPWVAQESIRSYTEFNQLKRHK